MSALSPSARPGMGSTLYAGGVTFRVWAPNAASVASPGRSTTGPNRPTRWRPRVMATGQPTTGAGRFPRYLEACRRLG